MLLNALEIQPHPEMKMALLTSRVRGWPFEIKLPEKAGIASFALVDQSRGVDFIVRHARHGAPDTPSVLFEASAMPAAIVEPAGALR